MTKAREIHNGEDVIDSRDVIERIEFLENMIEEIKDRTQVEIEGINSAIQDLNPEDKDYLDAVEEFKGDIEAAKDNEASEISEYEDELKPLKELAEEGESCSSDWEYGEALIREDYFVEYAQQFADDIGAIDRNAKWPVNHIDWEAAADDLLNDYSSVEFNGVTYYIRSS